MGKEVNCINSKVVLAYIKEHNGGDYADLLENLDPAIDALQDPESFLTDPNNWISSTVASKLYERARRILDDEMAAYKIGQYAVEKTSLGFKSLIVKVFGSQHRIIKNLQKINDKWNRNKKVELVEIKRSGAIVRLNWYKTWMYQKIYA
jgi:hypothetical protein